MENKEGQNYFKKTYDDIPFDKRKKLIELIDEGKWTIRSAAQQIGIKLCTAKYILYQYRRKGKISQKKRTLLRPQCVNSSTSVHENESQEKIQYILVPFPVYIMCSPEQIAPINLECKKEH